MEGKERGIGPGRIIGLGEAGRDDFEDRGVAEELELETGEHGWG